MIFEDFLLLESTNFSQIEEMSLKLGNTKFKMILNYKTALESIKKFFSKKVYGLGYIAMEELRLNGPRAELIIKGNTIIRNPQYEKIIQSLIDNAKDSGIQLQSIG